MITETTHSCIVLNIEHQFTGTDISRPELRVEAAPEGTR